MKKQLLLFLMLLTYSISIGQSKWDKSNCEKCSENQFVFDKITIAKLEKEPRFSESDEYADGRNLYFGAVILKNEEDSLSLGKYIKLSSILITDRFVLIGNSDADENVLIQNVKTKLFYVTNSISFDYIDYSRKDNDGFRGLIKIVPKVLSLKEQELIKRYKMLIKSGDANCIALRSIQNKCLTKGYFDDSKMTKIDRQTWNRNISALKVTYTKLNDIDKFEDKDNVAQDKLSTSELVSLEGFNTWLSNFFILD